MDKFLEEINVIMWESYMIKDRPFGRTEGRKIMEVLERWASLPPKELRSNESYNQAYKPD